MIMEVKYKKAAKIPSINWDIVITRPTRAYPVIIECDSFSMDVEDQSSIAEFTLTAIFFM